MSFRASLASVGVLSALWLGSVSASVPAPVRAGDPSGTYEIDPVHSTLLFRVKHLNTSWSFGRFNQVTGDFTLDYLSPEKSSVAVQVPISSLDTGTAKRDGHLKSPDFFDAAQFPDATFRSRAVRKSGQTKFTVDGELGFHGVKKPISVDLELVGAADGKIGLYGNFTIKRSDFGMKFMPDAVGDEVHLTVSIEGTQAAARK